MSENDFDSTFSADSESVIPGSPARQRLDARLRSARSIRASLRPQPAPLSYASASRGLPPAGREASALTPQND